MPLALVLVPVPEPDVGAAPAALLQPLAAVALVGGHVRGGVVQAAVLADQRKLRAEGSLKTETEKCVFFYLKVLSFPDKS